MWQSGRLDIEERLNEGPRLQWKQKTKTKRNKGNTREIRHGIYKPNTRRIQFPAPCSTVLNHSPSPWAAVVHWSALMPKALRSSRKHPIYSSFPWPPKQPAPPTNSPNVRHFGSVSSMPVDLISSCSITVYFLREQAASNTPSSRRRLPLTKTNIYLHRNSASEPNSCDAVIIIMLNENEPGTYCTVIVTWQLGWQ